MHLDVIDLRKFYYRTKLGRIVQRALRDKVERLFGDTKGQTILGYVETFFEIFEACHLFNAWSTRCYAMA
jgi:hypothetical protein